MMEKNKSARPVTQKPYKEDVPTELGNLKKLEQILIAQHIALKKLIVMPKGQQRKIRCYM